MPTQTFILASASARRRELLAQLGARFEIHPAEIEEPRDKPAELSLLAWVEALAYYKARAVAGAHPDRWILGADTIVVCHGALMGKPADIDEARAMLERQARYPSEVITGVAFVRGGAQNSRVFRHDATRIWMRDESELRERYLAGGEWQGKAGAYGIQDIGDILVARRDGSLSNVVGLPVELAEPVLKRLGLLN
jgi:septum formation protein